MIIRRLIWVMGMFVISMASTVVMASSDFPQVAQSHANCSSYSPQLKMNNGTKIIGTNGEALEFCSSNKGSGMPQNSCETDYCEITGTSLSPALLPSFKSNSYDNDDYDDCKNKVIVTDNNLEKFTGNSPSCKGVFSGFDDYYIKDFSLNNSSKVEFESGNYWIDSFQLNQNTEIMISGSVNLYFNTSIQLNNANIKLKDGASLRVVAYEEAQLNSGSEVYGNVYVKGKLSLNNNSTIFGRVNVSQLEMNSSSRVVDYSGSGSSKAVLKMHFDESNWSGITNEVIDSSGNGLHGVAKNGTTTAPASNSSALPSIDSLGTCGYGVFDNQSNQYIEIADNDLLDMDGSFTISAWVYPKSKPSSGNLRTIVSKDGNYEFHMNSDRRIYWWWEEKDGGSKWIVSQKKIKLDKWNFITVQYDSGDNEARLYINAKNHNHDKLASNTAKINGKPLQIGQDQNYPGRAFDGYIDEVQIFGKALTKSEIEELMAQRHLCSDSPALQCFTDEFNNNALSDLWVTSKSKGSFTPQIISNRLRFTEAKGNQSTASSYQRLFPAKDNLVEIEFDHYAYDGNGADGIAIVLSDATITPNPGAFGGPLGYGFKRGEAGFSGGWLGIGIDEYGNYSNEGGTGNKPGRRRQSVALRGSGIGEAGYQYLAGACDDGQGNPNGECLDPPVDYNNGINDLTHRYKIVIDSRQNGESNVEIFRKLGNGDWNTIVGPINVLDNQYSQSDIPEDFLLSITGSTGGSTNIHEIDNFQVCALDSRPIDDQIDHFRLTHSGSPSTCSAESVLIEACLDTNCNSLYSGQVTATLSPSTNSDSSWVDESGNSNNVVTFSGGQGVFDFRKRTKGNVTLGVIGSDPVSKPFQSTLCSDGASLNTANCTLNFVEGGFDIKAEDGVANLTRTATITGCDIDDFKNKTKTLAFWSSYESPSNTGIIGSPRVDVNDSTIGTSEFTSTELEISFDGDAKASVDLDYADAGQVRLNAQYTEGNGWNEVEIVGSDSFVSYPARIEIIAVGSEGLNTNGSKNSSSPKFEKAGAIFELQTRAYSGSDSERSEIVTPNYQQATSFLFGLLAPSGGQLGITTIDGVPLVSGDPTPSIMLGGTRDIPISVSEVGIFSFEFDFPAQYLNVPYAGNITIEQDNIASVGRFIPAYFSATPVTVLLNATCNSSSEFTYIGQPFGYQLNPGFYLNPVSVSGVKTDNYLVSGWWKYSNTWDGRSYISSNNLDLEYNEGSGATVDRNISSNSRIELVNEQLSYTKLATPIEPFNASFSLALSSEDLKDSDGVCYQEFSSGACLGYTFEDVDGVVPFYWGRLLIHDTYGPEVSPIRHRIEAQLFENGRFRTNQDDSCTDLVTIGSFDFASDDYTIVTSGSPTPPEVNSTLLISTLDKGESWIEFSAPGSGEVGLINSQIDLNAHGTPWLIDDLDGNGVTSGIAQFGIYRGNDRVIWWSEQN